MTNFLEKTKADEVEREREKKKREPRKKFIYIENESTVNLCSCIQLNWEVFKIHVPTRLEQTPLDKGTIQNG